MTITVDNNTKQAYYDTGAVTPYSSTVVGNATANLPPGSILYGETVAAGDKIYYKKPCARDGGGSGTIELTYDGVSTVTGTYGTYVADFKINNGALTTGVASNYDDAAIEAVFSWMPAQDANGWSIIPTPESTARLLYVDDTGGDNAGAGPSANSSDWYTTGTIPGTHYRTDPGAVNAYKDYGAAFSDFRDGQGDYILLKRGETFEITDAIGRHTLGAGKSHTFPHVFCDYGSGAKPIVTAYPDFAGADLFRTATDDSYNHFYNIDFYNRYRDPDHVDFVGWGLTEFGVAALSVLPGSSTTDVTGLLMEGCLFRFIEVKTDGTDDNETSNPIFVMRRCYSADQYSEYQNIGNLFGHSQLLLEENCFYHNGWYIPRDQATYGDQVSGLHDGAGPADTTFSDATKDYSGKVGQAVKNNTSNEHGVITAVPTTSTFTATKQLDEGGGSMTFDANDDIDVKSTLTHGQGFAQSHNLYIPSPKNTIIRRNLTVQSAGTGIKFTGKWQTDTDPGAPYPEKSADVLVYENYFLGNPNDINADNNLPDRNWTTRMHRYRVMDNVFTRTGEIIIEASISQGIQCVWWEDGIIANNIWTKCVGPDETSGLSNSGIMIMRRQTNTIVSRNIVFDSGLPTGTGDTVNRGSLIFNPDALPQTGVQILYNDFQNQNTDGKLIGRLTSGAGHTWEGSRYYSERIAAEWAELDEVDKTITQLVADTGETGYSETAVTYTDEQTHAGYMTDIGETTTIAALAALWETAISSGTWNEDISAQAIVASFKKGYTE